MTAVGASLIIALALLLIVWVWLVRRRDSARRREHAHRLSRELLPEIRAIVASSDPHGATEGRPADAVVYRRHRDELAPLLSEECLYAVELFYRSVEAYDAARVAVLEAFRDDSDLTLGDRIRAKDHRDRCLKDVYFTGEAAAQKLEAMR